MAEKRVETVYAIQLKTSTKNNNYQFVRVKLVQIANYNLAVIIGMYVLCVDAAAEMKSPARYSSGAARQRGEGLRPHEILITR